MQPFPTGTVVYLKTGSPPMTVENLGRDNLVTVAWFDAAGLHRDVFDPESVFEETPSLKELRLKCMNRMRGLLDASAKLMGQYGDHAPEEVG